MKVPSAEKGDRRHGSPSPSCGQDSDADGRLELGDLIDDLRSATCSPDDAVPRLRRLPFAELGFAKVDHHRSLRQGLTEAVYAPARPRRSARRSSKGFSRARRARCFSPAPWRPRSRPGSSRPQAGTSRRPNPPGRVSAVAWRPKPPDRAPRRLHGRNGRAAVAEECRRHRAYGFAPALLADCGVAGLHRLLASMDTLAEPTPSSSSRAWRALSPASWRPHAGTGRRRADERRLRRRARRHHCVAHVHASCAAGMTVVGIDNGYGAACAVARMLRDRGRRVAHRLV